MYVLIAILLTVLDLFLLLFFLSFFSCSLLFWFDDYLQCCIWVDFSLFVYQLQIFGLQLFWSFDMSLCVYVIVLSCSLNCKFISSVLHLYPPLLMISDFGGIIVHGWFHIFTIYIPLLVNLVICGIFVSCCCLSFLPREDPLVFVVRLV